MANGAIAASFKPLIDYGLNLGNGGEQSIRIGMEQLTAEPNMIGSSCGRCSTRRTATSP